VLCLLCACRSIFRRTHPSYAQESSDAARGALSTSNGEILTAPRLLAAVAEMDRAFLPVELGGVASGGQRDAFFFIDQTRIRSTLNVIRGSASMALARR